MKRISLFFSFALTALFACAAPLHAISQTGQYSFTHINTSNSNLSYDGVSKIMQDSRGFIWIGTFKGLNRYDGNKFKIYGKAELGLDSDFIHVIVEDSEGNIWVGTDTGVSRYIYSKDVFEHFDLISDVGTTPKNKVTEIYPDSRGNIWIISNYQGAFRFNLKTGSLTNFQNQERNFPEYNTDGSLISIRRMVEDGAGNFWISKYHNGLLHCDSSLKNLNVVEPSNDADYFKGDQIERMFLYGGILIVASNRNGISRYNPVDGKVEQLFSIPEDDTLVEASMSDNRWVWLSTTNGIWCYDLFGKEETVHINSRPGDILSIDGNYVFTSLVDRDGGLWVGTKDGGVNFCSAFQKNIVKQYDCEGKSLSEAIFTDFDYDCSGFVWATTARYGLLRYDIRREKLSFFKHPSLPDNICSICCDPDGTVWLGTFTGVLRLNPKNGSVRNYGMIRRTTGPSDPRIYLIRKSPDGEIYFGNTLGLYRYDREKDDFVQLHTFDGVFVTSVAWGYDGTLWVSSYATGLFHVNSVNGNIIANYRFGDGCGLPSDKISCVFVDRKGKVWTSGFSSGISCLEDGEFTVFNMENYPTLPSDVFFSAIQDDSDNLWFSSDAGLLRLDSSTLEMSVFSAMDGLLENKLSRSMLILPSGELFAGSDNGFVHFNPSSFETSEKAPSVIISKMGVGDKTVNGNVDLMEEVELQHDANSFGFQFSVMSLSRPALYRVRCKLEGYDKDWHDVSVARNVYYFNVPPGNYRLRVMSSASGYEWSEVHKPLFVTVKPAFFASWKGILLFSALFAGLFALVVLITSRRQKARNRKKEEEFRRETENEMFADKLNFFSHIVHEIKTPLTLIRTPLQSVMGKDVLDDDAKHDLSVMLSNTEYLTSLVNELLEFVRVERNGYVLDRKNIDLVEKMNSTVFNYADSARNRGVRLEFSSSLPHLWVSADNSALDKIVNNLLINALKYAESKIIIRLEDVEDKVELRVYNDGAEIPAEYREDIFKPFVQTHGGGPGLKKGVGIGLPLARSLARMHSGDLVLEAGANTVFLLSLPRIAGPAEEDQASDSQPGQEMQNSVLIVEDNVELRDFIARKFSGEYDCVQAHDAASALAILSSRNIDLLLTDISMPGMDGLQLCREIRRNVEISHLPIIILSARTSVESKIQAMEAGADLYIEKPFDMEYLRSSIKNIIDRRILMKSAFSSGIGDMDISMFGLPKRDEDFFVAFDNYIKEHLSDSELSNESIAAAMNMSQSSLIRKIKKMLDTTPNNYLKVKRLNVAAQMLKEPHGNNVTDICYAVGFTNVSYFAKCFKEQFGCIPTEYD